MSIIFSSIVPHSPFLIDTIGKDNTKLLDKTNASICKISDIIKEKKIDTILLVSSHGDMQMNTFRVNESTDFAINFEYFGDFSSKKNIKGNPDLAHSIGDSVKMGVDIEIIDKPDLNNSTGIPLYLLSGNNVDLKTVLIYCSGASLKEHYNFGEKIRTKIKNSKENIMILSSANLSHGLDKKSPAGYSSRSAKFDNKVIESIKNNNFDQILDMEQDLIDEVGGNGIRSIIIMLGIISGEKYKPELLTYEYPFGVGYLSMNFI